ncbi:branched-chain alpha-keto acid dehydrogenase subunit E2 [Streptococcus penaeicida]|uniref:Dihydrolipoamide acetyltransferase component of pyruvate dehydrogenase complex n=1 Tax=Streptococcus penaeicida TaxID=1765960 RepID=A0A2N8LAX4_9STRE|nr:dihydrolipoamide acetyltransferase family protein [Streptococcus penaeicida]PND47313.1 branched-chain alpha-keto acid dehydrogenase subunit E2 [Streptococcus penaeicida]
MAIEVVMPKLGLTMTEGIINNWLVKEGDTVSAGQTILEISSEKLTSDVESPESGKVLKILYQEGDTVKCKEAIALIGQEGEEVASQSASADNKNNHDAEKESINHQANESEVTSHQQEPAVSGKDADKKRIFITPLAKKIAKEKGYLIEQIPGTGGNGRITRRDVENFKPSEETKQSPVGQMSKAESQDYGAGLKGMRKTIASRMMSSMQNAAQLTLHRKADITELLAFREDIKGRLKMPLENGELGITTLLTKAVTKALRDHPNMNVWYANGQLIENEEIHIGMATSLDDGLVVPVIKNADKMTLSELGRSIKELSNQARKGTLPSNLYSGSTFSITNLGSAGIEYFTPILNSPEIAILGVGQTQKQLDLDEGGQLMQKFYLPLSLTFDHQVVDGAPASEFLASIIDYLEDPYQLLF